MYSNLRRWASTSTIKPSGRVQLSFKELMLYALPTYCAHASIIWTPYVFPSLALPYLSPVSPIRLTQAYTLTISLPLGAFLTYM